MNSEATELDFDLTSTGDLPDELEWAKDPIKIKGHFATPDYGVTGGLMSTMVSGYLLAPTAASAGLVASSSVVAPIIVTGIAVKGIIDRLTARNYTCTNTLKRIERARSRR